MFKPKHKLKGFQEIFCLVDCDSALEKFQHTIIDEIKHYVPEKKSKTLRHKSSINNLIKNLAAKSRNSIKDTCNRKQWTKKIFNRIRNLLQIRVLEKRRNFYQTFLVSNAKRATKTFFDTIKNLGGDTQKKQHATLTQEETENANKFFTTIGKTLADKLGPEKKTAQKIQASIASFYTKSA